MSQADHVFLVFGESPNDTASVAHLVRALVPAEQRCDVKNFRKPLVLARAAGAPRRRMAEEIASFVSAFEDAGQKAVAVAHRDCDAVEPAHEREAASLEGELKRAGIKHAIAAVPAWELETWWMLFPRAVATVRPCWRSINYHNQNVGSIPNSKERLARDLRPIEASKRKRCPEFEESDGIRIAEVLKNDRSHFSERKAISRSFERFVEGVQGLFESE